MKKTIIIALSFLAYYQTVCAQGLSINSNGASAHSAAMLDVQSSNKGVLFPRMTTEQRRSIATPATGLLIYQTDSVSGYYYFDGINWTRITEGLTPGTGGNAHDFIVKSANTGELSYRKAIGGVGINYIIALQGAYPSTNSIPEEPLPLLGEIRLFAGNFAPLGWAFCDGRELSIAQNTALFSLLMNTYGGNGQTTFALPDLRAAVPVHPGSSPANYNWTRGEKNY